MKLLKVVIFCFLVLGLCGNLFAQSVGGTTASSEPTELEKEITERAASIEITRLETKDPLY
ncbi:MAG: hypothetical protein ABIH45_06340, partial [Candidatus Omnitrophota bacterium]